MLLVFCEFIYCDFAIPVVRTWHLKYIMLRLNALDSWLIMDMSSCVIYYWYFVSLFTVILRYVLIFLVQLSSVLPCWFVNNIHFTAF